MISEEKLAKEDKRIHAVDIFNTGLVVNISEIKLSGHSYFCPTLQFLRYILIYLIQV